MIDAKLLKKQPELIQENLKRRRSTLDLTGLLQKDERRREVQKEADELRAHQKRRSEELARAMRMKANTDTLRSELRDLSARIGRLEETQRQTDSDFEQEALLHPNLLLPDVPDGSTGEDNPVVSTWGGKPTFSFSPKPHWEVGERLGILDFERAAKIAGARFTCLLGAGARMERALIGFMMDLHSSRGYTEIWPPFLINGAALRGTGQLPKFSADLFKCQDVDLWLAPTAEVPVTNFHANEILPESSLPIRYVAFTPCFRAEAGAAGKDTRGMIRQHQFDKVELVKVTPPATSYDELESMVGDAEEVLKRLELPYRVVLLATGEMGFAAAKTYDLEVWLPGQGRYREISSCSNCEAFQARRAEIRYRPRGGARAEYCHTINGSGVAVGRTLVAILENYQEADGSVTIPSALRPHMDGLERITPLSA